MLQRIQTRTRHEQDPDPAGPPGPGTFHHQPPLGRRAERISRTLHRARPVPGLSGQSYRRAARTGPGGIPCTPRPAVSRVLVQQPAAAQAMAGRGADLRLGLWFHRPRPQGQEGRHRRLGRYPRQRLPGRRRHRPYRGRSPAVFPAGVRILRCRLATPLRLPRHRQQRRL